MAQNSFSYDLGINSSYKHNFSIRKDSGVKQHSPTRAAIYSAVVPGLGQVYNKKYWKVPVIYGLMGTATFFMFTNRAELRKFKEDLNYATDTSAATVPINFPNRTVENLAANRDFYKQNRDYSILAMGLVYVLNIVDATVDAHLFEFNVNQNLAGRIDPQITPYGFKGAKITFQF